MKSLTLSKVVAFLALAFPLSTIGCGSAGETTACTTEARASVTVTVVDAQGSKVTDATVSFEVDGAAAKPCEAVGDTYACGFEIAGKFVITATRGTATKSGEVEVKDGECHVEGQTLTITLPDP